MHRCVVRSFSFSPVRKCDRRFWIGIERDLRPQAVRSLPSCRSANAFGKDKNGQRYHYLHTSRALSKKAGKGSSKRSNDGAAVKASAPPDPLDMKELEADLAKAIDWLKDELGKLKPGGRLNPDVLNDLRVILQKGSTNSVKLGDIAQVIPRGRNVNILVGEKEHVKPISSAILRSDLSLNPQQDPHNEQQLNIALPPPTTDARKQATLAAAKAGESAKSAIRKAAQTQQKKFRAMETEKSVRPDDRKKGESLMEKTVKKISEEAKKIVDSAKKVLESS